MKNILSLFFLLSIPFIIRAQIGEGTKTFDAQYEINEDFSLMSGCYGEFISDNVLLGGNFGASYFSNSFASFLAISINPYARYYFNSQQNNTFFYLQADYLYNRFLLDDEGSSSGFGFNLGLDHFIAPGVSLNTLAGINLRGESGNYSKSLGLTIDLDAFIIPDINNGDGTTIGQFQKGSLIVGGSTAGLSRSLDQIGWALSFSPRIGYFFTHKLLIGSEIRLTLNRLKDNFFGNFTNSQFAVSPFARYYLHYPKRFNPFIAAEFTYLTQSNTFQNEQSSNNRTIVMFGPGGNYFITPHIALEGILSLQFNSGTQDTRLLFTGGVQYFIH